MNNMQLFKLLMHNHADKEVKIIDEDANLTFTINRVEENENGVWIMVEMEKPE